ncbi:RIB43A-like with coiled-coils protein 2 [Ptiloglossa arizonensis]|uniref:RIB43A-like with coiled-coils protein 2 n=1 Tax=Ptiloglossa arizonensis TaxID=3350558 RepID=UPI003FA0187F
MLKFQTVTKEDPKLAASIQHRRRIQDERKQRIFDSRSRRIGIDKEFLDKQVAEKKQQRELERARESRLDENLIRSSRVALLLEKQREQERRRINLEIEHFRQRYQRTEDRRDYDLYDPNASKRSAPAGDEDPRRHGFLCAQKFEGEEADSKKRSEAQKEQTRWWIEKQRNERTAAERDRQEAEKAYQEAIVSRDERAAMLDRMERECRRRSNERTARFNRALAEEQEQRRRCEALRDEEDKKAEIYNHVTGDFLAEAKEQAESTRGPRKPLATRYKGMTEDELEAFRDARARQMIEIQNTKSEEKRTNDEWDRSMNSHARIANAYHRELDRRRTEIEKEIAKENLHLAEQQKSRRDYLNGSLRGAEPTPAFFEQFNKDAR